MDILLFKMLLDKLLLAGVIAQWVGGLALHVVYLSSIFSITYSIKLSTEPGGTPDYYWV